MIQTSLLAEPGKPTPSSSKEAAAVSPAPATVEEGPEKRKSRGRKRKADNEEVSDQVGDGGCRRSLRKKIKF